MKTLKLKSTKNSKNVLERLNSRFELEEKRISKLEVRPIDNKGLAGCSQSVHKKSDMPEDACNGYEVVYHHGFNFLFV